MLEEFGGIFLALSTLFRERASDLFFFGGENKTSKITWDFFPKNNRLLFFFCGDVWGKAAEVDRSFGR